MASVANISFPLGFVVTGLLLPIVSFILLLLLGRRTGKSGEIAAGVMFVSFAMTVATFFKVWGLGTAITTWDWITLADQVKLPVSLRLDNVSVLMLLVVAGVSFLVHLFSLAYMKGQAHLEKYYGYLGLFTAAMYGVVLFDNLFLLFASWELVGFASYLLIGFYFTRDAALKASKQAFIVNRIGDVGFLLGMLVLWSTYGTLEISKLIDLVQAAPNVPMLTLAGFGLFGGAIGKSAQFPLQLWLPDAMEGPTPVSALIHAATMVAAGVYLVLRMYFVFQPSTLVVVASLGAVTAFVGAVSALLQTDIKRVLAYSTVSQLGYMMIGMGVGAYHMAFFHLITHAFFKAALFLSAGAVIYAMHNVEHKLRAEGFKQHFDVQDMRNMGGLKKKMPILFILFLVSSLALVGVPLTSGFLSKDGILNAALSWAQLNGGVAYMIPVLAFVSVGLTAFYVTRQLIMVFFGDFRLEARYDVKGALDKVQDVSTLMKIALVPLVIGAVAFTFSVNPFDAENGWLLTNIQLWKLSESLLHLMHENHILVSLISITLILMGGFGAYKKQARQNVRFDQNSLDDILSRISINGFYLDRAADWVSHRVVLQSRLVHVLEANVIDRAVDLSATGNVKAAKAIWWFDRSVIDRLVNFVGIKNVVTAMLVFAFDRYIIDGIVNGTARFTGWLGRIIRSQHSGKAQMYIILAIIFIISIFVFIIVKNL